MSPSAEIAAILFSLSIRLSLSLGWWKWMYRVSPFSYLIDGLLGQAIGHQEITCSPVKLVIINAPADLTCKVYMGAFMSFAGGYLAQPCSANGCVVNENDTSSCQFCSTRTIDEFLAGNFNIYYSHRWRDLGLMLAFSAFNIISIYAFTYWFRIRTGSIRDLLRSSRP
ncbi:hypothetical protein C8J56DRAFT_999573 [Mycena floridula]|nr:hypothetical protein C8J56DRAFT_999573 [Mycena floridula]